MTKGSPLRLILMFALPLIAGNIFQQLYTIVDGMVVGKFVGVHALAAVGAVDWYNWMVLGVIQGFTQGFGIVVSQEYGRKNMEGLKAIIMTSLLLSAIFSAVLLVLMELSVSGALVILNVPEEIKDLAGLYLRIIFAGIPVVFAYNALSVILRSLGDSRSPLIAMVIATVSNIIMDVVFVVSFGWGVAGAAAATILAQFFSAVYCAVVLAGIKDISLSGVKKEIDRRWAASMIRLGTPVALQNAIISVGGIVLQAIVDTFGVIFIAGYTAANKLYGLLESAGLGFGYAMLTYSGQNLGAGDIKRIRQGTRAACIIAIISCGVVMAVMMVFGKDLLSLFISGSPEDAELTLKYAFDFLKLMCIFLPILYILHVVRSCLQGMGYTRVAMVSGFVELFMRISTALLLTNFFGETALYWAEMLAWTGADCILLPGYFINISRLQKGDNT